MKKMKRDVALRLACILALITLGLIVWSLLDPRPIPVILAMSVAQGLGTFSLVIFLVTVALDLRAAQRNEDRGGSSAP
jgi:hypothetical protein